MSTTGMRIESTTDYKKFSIIGGNRVIDQLQVIYRKYLLGNNSKIVSLLCQVALRKY